MIGKVIANKLGHVYLCRVGEDVERAREDCREFSGKRNEGVYLARRSMIYHNDLEGHVERPA